MGDFHSLADERSFGFFEVFSIKHFLGITWWHEKEKFYPEFFRFIETWYEGLNDLFGSALIITCVTVINTTKSKFIFLKLALLKIYLLGVHLTFLQ